MKWKTFVIGWALALSLLLFAQRRTAYPEYMTYSGIIDLTHAVAEQSPNWEGSPKTLNARVTATHDQQGYYARTITLDEHSSTHMDAPAHMAPNAWTVDQIPAERLVRPLVVLDVTSAARQNADYRVSMEDVARFEEKHGRVPQGAVVIAYTGWSSRWNSSSEYRNQAADGTMHFPGFSLEAAKFLVEAREAVGLGIDTLSVDAGAAEDYPVHRYCSPRGVYHLENVANLAQVPPTGAVAVVTPLKLEKGSGAPVRILALVR